MDEVYQTISRAINIDKERAHFTMIYNEVRNTFVNALKKDEIFKRLFCDSKLCGSYADKLKISKPDEFDLVIRLKFPFESELEIRPDIVHLESINIVLTGVLKCLEETNDTVMLRFLEKMVNNEGCFLQDKFQSWLEGRFAAFLTEIRYSVNCNGKEYRLYYTKNGPAHKISISDQLSINFIPGFRIEDGLSVTKRQPTEGHWDAIPRPNSTSDNPSFKCSFAESERIFMANKNHFKNAIRLMKKFCNMNSKMNNLKSYYIKTLFMWHAEESEPNFWCGESITTIMNVMFEKLETALKNHEIKWFWNEKVNLLQHLKPSQIESMYYEVKNTRKILLEPNILNIFLTKEEQRLMVPEDKETIEEQLPSKPIAVDFVRASIAAVATFLLVGLFAFCIGIYESS